MPRAGRAILQAKRLDALAPAACQKHGGEPRHDACPACLADSREALIDAMPFEWREEARADNARLRAEHAAYKHPANCTRCRP